jgi:hypothetical protein
MSNSRLLRRKEASRYLKETWGVERAPSTLAKIAVIGGGPIFRRVGRIPLYSTDDLDSWVGSMLSAPLHSTSDINSPAVGVRARKQSGSHSEQSHGIGTNGTRSPERAGGVS